MEAWDAICSLLLIAAPIVLLLFVHLAFRIPIEYPRTRTWPELARQTGLAYEAGSSLQWYLIHRHPPRLNGLYRGHHVTITRVTHYNYEHGNSVCTQASLQVRNHGDSSLSFHPRRLFQHACLPIRDVRFERNFTLSGEPPEFAQGAIELVLKAPPNLHEWLLRSKPKPFITLKGPSLTCSCDAPRDIQTQIALLNLLSDIARFTEEIPWKS
jgi:hypothetical protein